MSFGEIRRDIKDNEKAKSINQRKEKSWGMHDSSISSFGYSFSSTLPMKYIYKLYREGGEMEDYAEPFRKYIIDTLSESSNKNHTAIEFGGPGSKLFGDFPDDLIQKSVGVCLEDIRWEGIKAKDDLRGHSVVVGDIFDTKNEEIYKNIMNDIGTDKTDLIICRMSGALNNISKNPLVLDRVMRKWYSLLNDNGIIFVQFEFFPPNNIIGRKLKPRSTSGPKEESERDLEKWVNAIQEKFPNEIEIELGKGALRLHKKQGAPDQLPTLKELFN